MWINEFQKSKWDRELAFLCPLQWLISLFLIRTVLAMLLSRNFFHIINSTRKQQLSLTLLKAKGTCDMKHSETSVKNVMRKKIPPLWSCICLYENISRESKASCNHFLTLLRHAFLMHGFNYNCLKKVQKILRIANFYYTTLHAL